MLLASTDLKPNISLHKERDLKIELLAKYFYIYTRYPLCSLLCERFVYNAYTNMVHTHVHFTVHIYTHTRNESFFTRVNVNFFFFCSCFVFIRFTKLFTVFEKNLKLKNFDKLRRITLWYIIAAVRYIRI